MSEFRDPKFFEVKMNCLRCGRCCMGTQMELLPEDIERLLNLGYKLEDFAYFDGVYWRLKNRDGYCVFFDKEKKSCKIYEYRPIGCRLYPLQWDPITEEVYIDPDCPANKSINRSEIDRLKNVVKAFVKQAEKTPMWIRIKYGLNFEELKFDLVTDPVLRLELEKKLETQKKEIEIKVK